MGHAIQWIRSLIFVGQIYLVMPVFAAVFAIPALISREGVYAGVHAYCHWVLWTARWMVGVKSEIRGAPPTGEALVVAKHQSFLDIIMIISVTPRPRFVMKSSLRWAPFFGWYAMRMGCIPVDRGRRTKAIDQLVTGVETNPAGPGQLIIYPQGTRVAPGADKPYKIGPAILYRRLDQTCYPAATNVGVFWPRRGIYRKPGLAVVEFLEPIAPGLEADPFMEQIRDVIETHSDALMAEAGFQRDA